MIFVKSIFKKKLQRFLKAYSLIKKGRQLPTFDIILQKDITSEHSLSLQELDYQ